MKKITLFFLTFCSLLILSSCEDDKKEKQISKVETKKAKPVIKEFGYPLNEYKVSRDTIRLGDSFGAIMDSNGVSRGKVFQIAERIKDTFNPAKIVAGKAYTILKSKDTSETVQAFIYQHDKINYTIIDLQDSIVVKKAKKPVTIKRKTASGVITSSLSAAMDNEGLSILLADKIADLYQWKIDFFKIQKGDQFKIIYNEKYIDDTIYAGIANIEAAVLKHYDSPYYAFQFGKDSVSGFPKFYDDEAQSLQSFFLKAPLKFSRISSRYTKRRFHPVQKRWKAHKGTDYAAPRGTPIWSTADGVVIRSSYTRGNGNYVKVRHNEKYTTQYLHMTKRNVKVGQRVKQGDIIGFVGSTGLATGPHVCYRFWVYGKQVDPYKQNLPSSEPLKETLKPEYFKTIEPLKKELDELKFKKI
ncbi:M23 family metallopeptidase [Mesonia aquimarina]|uniref:M23 family metallopeptidase n=1 Tax=Mesonia aquimarina TaxID=1504967 RepID=UPI000EF6049A|nr:peptidoglycan DD-metalloendopeptidase family protein [Mesonia aquimarina]